MAGWVGGAASAMMLASVFTIMPKLRTVDTRAAITDYLSKGSGQALGIDLDTALLLARIGLFVTGAAAAATLVFTVFVMRRDRQSRIAVSVMALPILLCGVFVDPFLAGFILASIVLLWTRPASDWFAGRAPRQPVPAPQAPMPALPPVPWNRDDTRPAPFTAPYGEQRAPVPPPVRQEPTPWAPPPLPAAHRPASVLTACLVTWVASGLSAMLMVVSIVAASSEGFRRRLAIEVARNDSMRQLNLSLDSLVVFAQVLAGLAAVWCLASCAVAVFAFLGQTWARVTLVISAAGAALVSIVAGISFPGFLLVTAAAVAVVVLLLRGDSGRWYDSVRRRRGPASQPARPPGGTW